MDYAEIPKKAVTQMAVKPNLSDLSALGAPFDWTVLEKELGMTDKTKVNLAHMAIDRHAASPLRDKTALYWEGKNGESETYTSIS